MARTRWACASTGGSCSCYCSCFRGLLVINYFVAWCRCVERVGAPTLTTPPVVGPCIAVETVIASWPTWLLTNLHLLPSTFSLSIHPTIQPSNHPTIQPSNHPSIHLSMYYLSLYLYLCLSVSLSHLTTPLPGLNHLYCIFAACSHCLQMAGSGSIKSLVQVHLDPPLGSTTWHGNGMKRFEMKWVR